MIFKNEGPNIRRMGTEAVANVREEGIDVKKYLTLERVKTLLQNRESYYRHSNTAFGRPLDPLYFEITAYMRACGIGRYEPTKDEFPEASTRVASFFNESEPWTGIATWRNLGHAELANPDYISNQTGMRTSLLRLKVVNWWNDLTKENTRTIGVYREDFFWTKILARGDVPPLTSHILSGLRPADLSDTEIEEVSLLDFWAYIMDYAMARLIDVSLGAPTSAAIWKRLRKELADTVDEEDLLERCFYVRLLQASHIDVDENGLHIGEAEKIQPLAGPSEKSAPLRRHL